MNISAKKRVVVLYDNQLLFDVITTNLEQIPVTIDSISQSSSTKYLIDELNDDLALIIIAISSARGEPIVALYNSSLIGQIGRIPLLIISERKFDSIDDAQIFHLDFPFEPSQLRYKVQTLINQ